MCIRQFILQKNMAKKTFKIRAKFVFGGQVKVQAHNRQEAEAIVKRNIIAELDTINAFDDDIVDCDFRRTRGDMVINRNEEEEI